MAVNADYVVIPDKETAYELHNFGWYKNKPQARRGRNDDRVFTLGMARLCALQRPFREPDPDEEKKEEWEPGTTTFIPNFGEMKFLPKGLREQQQLPFQENIKYG